MCIYDKGFDLETNLKLLNDYTAGLYAIAVESNGKSDQCISISEFSVLFLPVRDSVFNIYRDFQERSEKAEERQDSKSQQPDRPECLQSEKPQNILKDIVNANRLINRIGGIYGELFNLAGGLEDENVKRAINDKGYELMEIYEAMKKWRIKEAAVGLY